MEAVRRAAAGDNYLNPRLGARVAAEPPPGPPDGLSDREVEVLRMIALGHTNAEIAEELGRQYTIAYRPTNRAHDGKWRAIDLKLSRPDVIVRTRKGYKAPKG